MTKKKTKKNIKKTTKKKIKNSNNFNSQKIIKCLLIVFIIIILLVLTFDKRENNRISINPESTTETTETTTKKQRKYLNKEFIIVKTTNYKSGKITFGDNGWCYLNFKDFSGVYLQDYETKRGIYYFYIGNNCSYTEVDNVITIKSDIEVRDILEMKNASSTTITKQTKKVINNKLVYTYNPENDTLTRHGGEWHLWSPDDIHAMVYYTEE